MILTPQLLHRTAPIPSRQSLVTRAIRARYHGGDRVMPVQGAVVHMTDGGSVESTMGWLNRPDAGKNVASYNTLVEDDGRLFVTLDAGTVAYHAGVSEWNGLTRVGRSLNEATLGIALANKHSATVAGREGITEAAYLSLVWWLCVVPCERYGVHVDHVLGHLEVSPGRKPDPWTYALSMDALRADVASELTRRAKHGRGTRSAA